MDWFFKTKSYELHDHFRFWDVAISIQWWWLWLLVTMCLYSGAKLCCHFMQCVNSPWACNYLFPAHISWVFVVFHKKISVKYIPQNTLFVITTLVRCACCHCQVRISSVLGVVCWPWQAGISGRQTLTYTSMIGCRFHNCLCGMRPWLVMWGPLMYCILFSLCSVSLPSRTFLEEQVVAGILFAWHWHTCCDQWVWILCTGHWNKSCNTTIDRRGERRKVVLSAQSAGSRAFIFCIMFFSPGLLHHRACEAECQPSQNTVCRTLTSPNVSCSCVR